MTDEIGEGEIGEDVPMTGPPAGARPWGSTPEGWPPPPPTPPAALASTPPAAQPTPPPVAPPDGPVNPPRGPATGAGGGGSWNYGYGGMWSPPPEPPRPPNTARRIVAAIAVITLVLGSAAVGAVVSAAVHDNSSPTATSPFPRSNGNGFANNGAGDATNGNGNSASSGTIANKVNPALVNIYTTIKTGAGNGQAAGTGMVITSSGEVLTNNHVIADSSTVRVELVATGATHNATVLGYDLKDDVALLQIEGVSDLDTVTFADASKVAIGDEIVALGNAGGRGGTPAVSSGSVTALDQKVTAGDQGSATSETLSGMIEISAPIEPGDSGGPLVNSTGQVIGMNTAAATSDRFSGQNGSSTAFAIPINRALAIARQIEKKQDSANVHIGERGLLGVQVQDIASQAACSSLTTSSGALVSGVQSGSPASSAGLRACDVIVSLGGKNVASTSDLNAAMYPYHPGENVGVGWIDQSGQRQQATLALIAGPPV